MKDIQDAVAVARAQNALNLEAQKLLASWKAHKEVPAKLLMGFKRNPVFSLIEDLEKVGYRVSDTIDNSAGPLPKRKIIVTGVLQGEMVDLIKLNIEIKTQIFDGKVLPYFYGNCNYIWGTCDWTSYHNANLEDMSRFVENIKKSVFGAIANRGILPIDEPTPTDSTNNQSPVIRFIYRIIFREN